MLKEVAGGAEHHLELGEGATLKTVFDHYAARFPRVRELSSSIVLARNREFAGPETGVREGDEVAFLPPVSGGACPWLQLISENGDFFGLTRRPLEVRRLAGMALRADDGAVVTFEGVVRNNTNGRRTRCLDYEGYEPMAIGLMARIGAELKSEFAIGHVAIAHRLGRLLVGETSVAIVVTAPHRKAALEAAHEGINRIKNRVPIWKKEFFADGQVWVEGEWDRAVPRASR